MHPVHIYLYRLTYKDVQNAAETTKWTTSIDKSCNCISGRFSCAISVFLMSFCQRCRSAPTVLYLDILLQTPAINEAKRKERSSGKREDDRRPNNNLHKSHAGFAILALPCSLPTSALTSNGDRTGGHEASSLIERPRVERCTSTCSAANVSRGRGLADEGVARQRQLRHPRRHIIAAVTGR